MIGGDAFKLTSIHDHICACYLLNRLSLHVVNLLLSADYLYSHVGVERVSPLIVPMHYYADGVYCT